MEERRCRGFMSDVGQPGTVAALLLKLDTEETSIPDLRIMNIILEHRRGYGCDELLRGRSRDSYLIVL